MSDGKILAFYAPYTGAGKSTAAGILNDGESIILSFADPLYYCAESLIPDLSSGDDKSNPRNELGGKSLREFLIYFGQAGREFYQNIWSERMRRVINKLKGTFNIIIDDLRFPNEFAMLREEGAKIVRITNPDREIIEPKIGTLVEGHKIIVCKTEGLLEEYTFDYELVNYKRSIEEYKAQLAEMMRELWP